MACGEICEEDSNDINSAHRKKKSAAQYFSRESFVALDRDHLSGAVRLVCLFLTKGT